MPKPEMTPTLAVLNDLSYLLECAALDYMGEGKSALEYLCERLECDPAYAVQDHAKLAVELREALEYYRGGNRQRGANILSWVSRRLWKQYIDESDITFRWRSLSHIAKYPTRRSALRLNRRSSGAENAVSP
jgi:hypothetical protein